MRLLLWHQPWHILVSSVSSLFESQSTLIQFDVDRISFADQYLEVVLVPTLLDIKVAHQYHDIPGTIGQGATAFDLEAR